MTPAAKLTKDAAAVLHVLKIVWRHLKLSNLAHIISLEKPDNSSDGCKIPINIVLTSAARTMKINILPVLQEPGVPEILTKIPFTASVCTLIALPAAF